MKRRDVLKKLKAQAKAAGKDYSETELTNHTGITIGDTRSTLGRHAEIDDVTARKFFDQFANEFGKGWWR
ncbi:ribonuclease PH [Leifsonia shinshuensis]|uniref:ribonuclease PH n=1 Tax=Leifsonia shinshuensis TaxID=150026 RepID=UPI001F5154DD|nr:ribonuclease PH [Leifsonia shinshuensis]MCI0155805.1 ribonuclease PH [Leifsonia shinshuensis]